MTHSISMKSVLRAIIFVIVFLAVMSVSFLVEAHDLPAGVVAAEVAPDDTAVTIERSFPMTDVTDGLASWYGRQFHGRRTASGRKFDMHAFTAAHRSLPFGSLLRVVNPSNGRTVIVEVTDRGPFIRRRVVDLSYAAAKELGVSVAPVEMDAITPGDILAHYNEQGDSLVVVIDEDMDIVVLPATAVRPMAEGTSTSLTEAYKSVRESSSCILVMPAEDGKGLSFVPVQRIPSAQSSTMLRTEGRIVSASRSDSSGEHSVQD